MQNFEKLGAFYLGKSYDLERDRLNEDLVLYDARDLTTHAVIIGMTGSGKTGLGISLLEEAALDKIPVIAIDPKGDLGNLLLTFPKLDTESFRPWVNQSEAANNGLTVDAFAAAQATLWRNGLKKWGQDGERIARLRATTDLAIYTPGSSAGLPVSVLRSFDAPPAAVQTEKDLYRERIQATATSILALLGQNADPITSREHILLANILQHGWNEGRSLSLSDLITAIQRPPIARIGVMDLDSFYPAKDRFGLAMKLNNLLAAPGFEAWMEGDPLQAGRLLYTDRGRPRISVMSIAHLSDAERMFFVSMLLNELIAWMRSQPGTGSLRAILYMDEIFGYMPPVANPPSKTLFLTLLKQARAYGVGLVLATQNPVDLDYKGLSNTGTWFIGRLQTERDKARVMEGLEGAAAGGEFDRQRMEQILAGLGKRRFLLHNVHEDEPVVFNTRWAMSYLPGPLTRDQIKVLMVDGKAAAAAGQPATATPGPVAPRKAAVAPPVLPAQVEQYFVPAALHGDAGLMYRPLVIGAAEVLYASARYNVNEEKRFLFAVEVEDGPVALDWDEALALQVELEDLETDAPDEARFAECPAAACQARNYAKWKKLFNRWLRQNQVMTLHRSPTFKAVSAPGETEGEFRARLQQLGNEDRDLKVAKLRKKYASKITTLENRLRRAEQTLEREGQQAKQRKIDTAISFGTAILGAVLGRKKVSYTSASRVGTAVKGLGRIGKESGDVERAEQTAVAVRRQLSELAAELEQEVEKLEEAYDAQNEELAEVLVKPRVADVTIHFVALGWLPYLSDGKKRLVPAWR